MILLTSLSQCRRVSPFMSTLGMAKASATRHNPNARELSSAIPTGVSALLRAFVEFMLPLTTTVRMAVTRSGHQYAHFAEFMTAILAIIILLFHTTAI